MKFAKKSWLVIMSHILKRIISSPKKEFTWKLLILKKNYISIIYQKLHNLASHPVFGPYFDPSDPPLFILNFECSWKMSENERQICSILISDKTLFDEGCECKNWAWKNSRPESESSVRVNLNLCTPGVLYVLSFDFIPSFTRHKKKPAPSSIPSSRYFYEQLVHGLWTRDLFCIIFACVMLCPGQMVIKKKIVICLPRQWFVVHAIFF
jgi:hypothetical protein